jgi:hypothetical protein
MEEIYTTLSVEAVSFGLREPLRALEEGVAVATTFET